MSEAAGLPVGEFTGQTAQRIGRGSALGDTRPLLLVVNSGRDATYRGWTLQSMSQRYRLWLLSARPAEWELPYIVGQTFLDVLDGVEAAVAAAERLKEHGPIAGVVCYDEMRIVAAARLAERLGLPTATSAAVRSCHDKLLLRRHLGEVRSLPAADAAEACAAAARIGYPVIVKPRALAASEGVVKIDQPDQIEAGFGFATNAYANFGALATDDRGVLVEQYLDGPEVAVDAVVWRGRVRPAFISHKRQDLAPTFEETGHLVDAEDPLLRDAELLRVVQSAHTAAGFDHGVTHTEIRLTPDGPQLIELNARLGGDLITHVGLLATGIDLAAAAADVAADIEPDLTPRRRGVAAVRYLYPAYDLILEQVRIHHHLLPRHTWSVTPLAAPGTPLRRPPASFVKGRAALGYALADDVTTCQHALTELADAVEITGAPIPAAADPRPSRARR
ncbi:ATP-grasp domain-containing protein [Nocardia sp. NPDC023852]|uniref:ATP-grasp domain-containing protein n=1 Tax=Nocardia sp. NPDC023852 TaxID=3154697 RepID=UPI0033D75385